MEYLTLSLGLMPTNCYIIYDEITKDAAVIDPADEADKILQTLQTYQLNLKFILLTHGHADHIMAVNSLREKTNCQLAITETESYLLKNPTFNCSKMIFGRDYIVEKSPEILLHSGDKLTLGKITVNCLQTPGHTAGSCVYIADDIMFSGDTLFCRGYGRTDLYSGSEAELSKSLGFLSKLDVNYRVCPGHGSKTMLFNEKIYMNI